MYGDYIINGRKTHLAFPSDARLMTALRDAGFTEVKNGCGAGTCGACAVLIDDKLIYSCQVLAASVIGSSIKTVKGIGTIHRPHPIQEALVEAGAVQCGFCIPGKVLAIYSLLKRNPNPCDGEIIDALHGHICRCTGYVKIIDGVRLAIEKMDGKSPDYFIENPAAAQKEAGNE